MWTLEELNTTLGDSLKVFQDIFNINELGLWENEKYVLYQNKPLLEIANKHKITLEKIETIKKDAEKKLLAIRTKRNKPTIDYKIVCSWNAMYITGLLDAYTALENETYLSKAISLFRFMDNHFIDEKEDLFHSIAHGKREIKAYLDDYAFYIQAAINLFEHTGNTYYLNRAKSSTSICFDLFFNTQSSFFYFSDPANALVTPAFETEDNVIPSSNAIMALNLQKLGILYDNPYYSLTADKMIAIIVNNIDYGSAYSHWLLAYLYQNNALELTISGQDAVNTNLNIRKQPLTRSLIFPLKEASQIPYFKNIKTGNNETEFHLCENHTCTLPTSNSSLLDQITF